MVQNKGIIPWMLNSGKRTSAIQTKNILITKVNKLKVRTLRGRVINFKTGLIKKFIKPKHPPTKIKICQPDPNSMPNRLGWPGTISKFTPETKLVAKKIPKIPAMICKIKRLMFLNNIKDLFLKQGHQNFFEI